MAGDEQPVAVVGARGDDRHDECRRQPVVGQLAQQAVLAQRQVVGELLHDVGRPVPLRAELDEAHDVAVQAEHAVHVRQVPIVEVDRERQQPEVRMVRRIGELQPHRPRSDHVLVRILVARATRIRTETRRRQGSVALTSSQRASSVARSAARRSMLACRGQRLDAFEAATELGRRAARRQLGVDVDVAGDVHGGDHEIAELVRDACLVTAGDRLAQLGELLVDLGQRTVDGRASRSRPWPPCGRGAGCRRAPGAIGRRRRTPTSGPSPPA